MRPIKRIDILFFVYLAISTVFLALSWNSITNGYSLLGLRIILVPTLLALIYWGNQSEYTIIRLLRESYPLVLSGYFYSETVFYNKLIFNNLDPYLIKLEAFMFGMQPSLAFSANFPNLIFSELMYFGYFSFYLIIFCFALYMFFKRRDYFNEAIFKLIASLYIFYFIFSLFPSAGPQFYFSSPENILPDAYAFNHIMHLIQDIAEQPTGAFPSSHVGISLIILILSYGKAPAFFKYSWPFVIILILSTVYIKAHYAIDIIGGLLIAPIILYLSDFLYHLPFKKHVKKNN